MDPQTYIGCEVTVILQEGSYHGTIHRFDTADKRITLKDVSNPINGNKYPGIRHFYASEILDMVLDNDYDESLIDHPPCAVIQTDDVPAYEDAHPVTPTATNDKIPASDSPPATSCDRYTIIDKFNGQFQEAITFIEKQMMIGFHIQSFGEGRQGKIRWIAISVKTHAYFFDFLALGKDLFKNGLQDVLESKTTTKIIHDCRFISDLLFHKYSVNLSTVFDTQVADAFVHRTWYSAGNKNIWPKFVQTLSVSLFSHLKLTTEEIAGLNACEGRSKVELDLWAQRPLSIPLAETLTSCVKYLDELRLILIEKMMVEFMAGVDIYLHTVRNLPTSEVSWYANKAEFLPKTFQQMNKFSQVVKDRLRNREQKLSTFERNLNSIQQMTPNSSKIHRNFKSVPSDKSDASFTNTENTVSNRSPNQIKVDPVADYAYSNDKTIKNSNRSPSEIKTNSIADCALSNDKIIESIPRLAMLNAENKSPHKTDPDEEDIMIQAARKMISSDIPSDLLDLLKTPVKSPPPLEFDSNQKTSHYLDPSMNKNSHFNQTGVEWSKYRSNSLNSSKINLLPAGCNMSHTKKTKHKQFNKSVPIDKRQHFLQKSPPQSCQLRNNDQNEKPFQHSRQNSNLNDRIRDPFSHIPYSNFTENDNLLDQITTYPGPQQQSFQYRTNKNFQTNRNANTYDDHSSSSADSTSDFYAETKSPVSSHIKKTHPTRTSSEEFQMNYQSTEENGMSRNLVNGNGISGNGNMTHIERLIAIWRNDCK